jgi:hypothetical protein
LNFKLTLSIRQLKDNPNVEKPLSLPILIWHRLATGLYQKGRQMSLIFSLGACEFDLVWSSLSSWFRKRQLCLAVPLLESDRRPGYVCVLVWFHLGIFIFILISILCSIPDRLSSDFLGTSMMKGCGSLGMGAVSSG